MSKQKTKKPRMINVFPYTVNGHAWYANYDHGEFEVELDFQINVDVDEDEFMQALKEKNAGKKYIGRVMENTSDLAICKVEEFFDKQGIDYDDVEISECEGRKTKRRVKEEDDDNER